MDVWVFPGTYVLIGLSLGWARWRLPHHWARLKRRIHQWQEELPWNQREIARIEGGILPGRYTPNVQPPPPTPPIRERVRRRWKQWKRDTAPRTPEQYAEACYRSLIGGHL